MSLPYALDDLTAWRQPLLNAPKGSLSRQFGERLSDLQEAVKLKQIDRNRFTACAHKIVADLNEAEHDMTYWHHHLANADIGLQYKKFKDAGLACPPAEVNLSAGDISEPASADHMEHAILVLQQALNYGNTVTQAVEQARLAVQIDMRFSIVCSTDVAALRNVAAMIRLNNRHRG